MASKVGICNIALSKLGAQRIISLSDNTTEAKLCNVLYDEIAEEVMIEGQWTSTIKRAELNRLVNDPLFGYAYQYQLPTNPRCLKVLGINEDIAGVDFRVEGKVLLTDETSVNLRYIGFIDDTNQYDVFLKRAIVYRLASELSFPITGNAQMADRLYERYLQIVQIGLTQDAQQGSSDIITSTALTEIR